MKRMRRSTLTSILITFLIIFSAKSLAKCITPTDGMKITENTKFCSDTYDLFKGITIEKSNIELDCNQAILRGAKTGAGIKIKNAKNITVKNCNIATYDIAIVMNKVLFSSIINNNFVKNRIGIRALESYENKIEGNNDKSSYKAASMVNSKFNLIIFNNKNIEGSFCAENICNKYKDINPCIHDDFYCSPKCTPETDSDCREKIARKENSTIKNNKTKLRKEKIKKTKTEEVKENIKEIKKNNKENKKENEKRKRNIDLKIKILIYLTTYLITFKLLKKRK
ncbi:hypothetical protein B6U93_01110 [Candidatus Woesearchaeota archaeon ex4484_78]|nr:MAG: hypothetical protein B6U93_01110 [Candidatus Woesearchaeota archaeon ex4484_78]